MSELGKIENLDDGLYELRMERRYAKPVEEVWDALTRPERMKNWLAETTYDPTPGGAIVMDFGDGDVSRGEVRAFDPPRVFEFTSVDAHEKAETLIRFELRADGQGTELLLTQTRQTAWSVQRTAPGWHASLDLFEGVLEGDLREWGPAWEKAKGLYVERTRNLD